MNDRIMEKLIAYSWPGNINELQNLLRRLLLSTDWEEIFEDLQTTFIQNKTVFARHKPEEIKWGPIEHEITRAASRTSRDKRRPTNEMPANG